MRKPLAAGAGEVTNLYSVTYNTNNSTGGITPATQTAETNSPTYSFTTPEQNDLVRDGYTFMGWADSPTAPVQQYDPGSTISLSSADSTKTLYAVWGKEYTYKYSAGEGGGSLPANGTIMLGNLPYTMTPTGSYANIYRVGYLATGWNSITFATDNQSPTTTPTWTASTATTFNTMQEIGTTGYCNALTESGKQLFDIRDGKKYWVAKLKDGNCWMTQNLDLDLNGRTLSTTDSDVTSNWTSTTGASALWSTTGNNDIKYYDPGVKYCPNGNCSATNSTSSNNGHDAQGNYYSFNAATAGTGQSYTTANQNAPSSICPKGWRLPISNTTSTDKSFGKLLNGLNTATIMAAPYYYIYGGIVNGGSLNSAGSQGYYWSSTARSATAAYCLIFNSSNVYPSNNTARFNGFSVRCVAR